MVADAGPLRTWTGAVAVGATILAPSIPCSRTLPAGRGVVLQGAIAQVAPGPGVAGATSEGQDHLVFQCVVVLLAKYRASPPWQAAPGSKRGRGLPKLVTGGRPRHTVEDQRAAQGPLGEA